MANLTSATGGKAVAGPPAAFDPSRLVGWSDRERVGYCFTYVGHARLPACRACGCGFGLSCTRCVLERTHYALLVGLWGWCWCWCALCHALMPGGRDTIEHCCPRVARAFRPAHTFRRTFDTVEEVRCACVKVVDMGCRLYGQALTRLCAHMSLGAQVPDDVVQWWVAAAEELCRQTGRLCCSANELRDATRTSITAQSVPLVLVRHRLRMRACCRPRGSDACVCHRHRSDELLRRRDTTPQAHAEGAGLVKPLKVLAAPAQTVTRSVHHRHVPSWLPRCCPHVSCTYAALCGGAVAPAGSLI